MTDHDGYDFGPPPMTDDDISAADLAMIEWDNTNQPAPKRRTKNSPPLSVVQDGDEDTLRRVRYAIPDAPVGEDHKIPDGWDIEPGGNGRPGLRRLVRKDDHVVSIPVSPSPFVLSAWVSNNTTRQKQLEVSWRYGAGKWRSRTIDRSKLDKAKAIVALADHGAPINGSNAADVVKYLAQYELLNKDLLPVRQHVEQCGWHDGQFVLGGWSTGGDTTFSPADAGDQQMAEAIGVAGTREGWMRAAELAHKYPRVEIALHAALAAPLLKICGCSSFVLEWCGETSIGKTSALRIAASVYGHADERSSPSYLASWSATRVWLERAPALYCDLPLCLDETMRAAKPGAVPDAVYDLVQGRGKGRGSIAGTQVSRAWRTVVLSTGEDRIVDLAGSGAGLAGGVAARVLSLWGSPFGPHPQATDVAELNHCATKNHGMAGRVWVQWLAQNKDLWPKMREEWQALRDQYARDPDGKVLPGVASRIADYLAVIELAGRYGHKALKLPWDYESCVDDLLVDLRTSPSEADRAASALSYLCDVISSRRSAFWSATAVSDRPAPSTGWLGRWDDDASSKKWETVGIFRHHLDKILQDKGYHGAAVMRTLKARRSIETGPGGKSTAPTRLDGQLVRLVMIKRSVIDREDVTQPELPCVGKDDPGL